MSIAAQIQSLLPFPNAMRIGGTPFGEHRAVRMDIRDPASGLSICTVPVGTAGDVDQAVAAAKAAFPHWRSTAAGDRGRLLMRVAQLIKERASRFAHVETLQTGKPLSEALADVSGAAALVEYYAGAADKLQGDSVPGPQNTLIFTLLEPVGVTGHIVPWNFPLGTALRGLAPAIATGNSVVLKPAEQTPLTALMLADLMAEAGLPSGVLNVVTGTGSEAGAALSAHPDVAHMTFTGSVTAGKAVMQGAASHLASVTLELGGKSPIVVLDDAATERVVAGVLKGIYKNCGQICSAGSRLVVVRSRRDEIVERLVAASRSLAIDHGLRDPALGPLISEVQAARVNAFVVQARDRGASLLTGGHPVHVEEFPAGNFYAPTIVDGVGPDDEIAREEVFGPVLTVQSVDGPEEAFTIANRSRYGLCAGVFTADISRALTIARDLDVGQVYVNDYFVGGPETPFGGVKDSGFGRERGWVALANYCRVKSVAIRL